MSAAKWNWTACFHCFYWIGVAMSVAFFTLIVVGHTQMVGQLEAARFPPSWAFAGAALLAFLAAEFCHYASLRGLPKLEAPSVHRFREPVRDPVVRSAAEAAGPPLGAPSSSSLQL